MFRLYEVFWAEFQTPRAQHPAEPKKPNGGGLITLRLGFSLGTFFFLSQLNEKVHVLRLFVCLFWLQ